jgi:hypothetical protein
MRKGFGRKWLWPNRDSIPAFAWRTWGISWKLSFSVAGVPAEILTEDQRPPARNATAV